MNNNLPIWLEKNINIFDSEQIHHAFIISGSKGIGKSLLIEALAEKILNNKISLENNSMFGIQNKTLVGLHADNDINKYFLLYFEDLNTCGTATFKTSFISFAK